jgi:hypothetical protein
MNIALVAPASRIINVYPPLGLGIIAAILIKEGHRVKIFDFSLRTNGTRKDSETICRKSWKRPWIIFIRESSTRPRTALTRSALSPQPARFSTGCERED